MNFKLLGISHVVIVNQEVKAWLVTAAKSLQEWRKPKILTCSDKRGYQQLTLTIAVWNQKWAQLLPVGITSTKTQHRGEGAWGRNATQEAGHQPRLTHLKQLEQVSSNQHSGEQLDQHVQVSATTWEKLFEILSLSTVLLPLCLPHPPISLATEKTESNSLTFFNRS